MLCWWVGKKGERVRERGKGKQRVEEKEKGKGGGGRRVRGKCYLLTINYPTLVAFCLCSCRGNGKDIEERGAFVIVNLVKYPTGTNTKCKTRVRPVYRLAFTAVFIPQLMNVKP